jgi:hypothetical protein
MNDRQTVEMALTKVGELEKRVRLLSRVAAVLCLGCFFLLLGIALVVANSSSRLQSRINRIEQSIITGKPFPAEVIEARVFRVRDGNSKLRGEFAIRPGGLELVLQDEKEQARLSISVGDNGITKLGFYDPGEKSRMQMMLDQEGRVSQTISDRSGKAGYSTSVAIDGSVYSALYGADWKGRIGMTVSSDGTGRLSLQHKDGNPQMALEVSPDGSLEHSFFDKKGARRILTTLAPDGIASQRFYTSEGGASASLVVRPDGSVGQAISGKGGNNSIILMVNEHDKLVLGVMDDGTPHALYERSQ